MPGKRKRKRTQPVVHVNMHVMIFDCPMAGPDMVRSAVWDVMKSPRLETLFFRSVIATLSARMSLPGYTVKQDGRTYREGK